MNLLLKFLILLSFLSAIFLNQSKFTSKFDYEKTRNDFNNSPYILGNNYKTIIQDEDFDAINGYMYINRIDLNKTVYDHPPFGKFLIGLSIFLTGNQNNIQIFVSLFVLIAFYYLSKEVLKNDTLALLLSLVLSLEPLFREQISTSLLDADLLLLLTLSLLFTLKSLSNKKWVIGIVISLGLFSAIKFPANSIIVVITIIFFYLSIQRSDLIRAFIKYFLIVPIIYSVLYIPFVEKFTLQKFFDLQIFAIKWHKSHLPDYPKFEIFRLLLFNQWRTWWGSKPFISVPYFHFLWPLSLINLSIFAIAIKNKKLKPSKEIILIFLWCLLYLAFSSFRVVFPRYLLLLLPFLYLILIYLVQSILASKSTNKYEKFAKTRHNKT